MVRWLNYCLLCWAWFCALPSAWSTALVGTTILTNGPSSTWHPQEGRLQKITSGTTEVTYTRHSDSALLHRTESRQANNLRLTTERTFDFLERLTDLTHTGPPAPAAFGYAYNDANQRTTTRQPDGTTWAWDYDPLGQLQNANLQRTTDSALLPGRQYHYQYDNTGNRLTASQGDTANPAQHPQSINYQPSTLNQYTGITNPAYAEASGEAHPTATVTTNGEPTNRLGPYFHKRLPVSNSGTDPVFTPIAIAATENGTTETETRTALTLPASESPEYDADGNLKQDALWLYTWDAENRLAGMESSPAVPAGAKKKLTFTYDSQSRRIRKQVWQAQPTAPHAWILTQDRRFHYQGWNLLAEADPDKTFIRTYLWGLDFSGTFTGAGGTGGLLAINIARGPANVAGTHLVTTDGQGNVTQLLSATTGQPTAAYTYDPFGQLLSATGPAASANPIRFSTRYEDPETQLLYYGYRFFDPSAGRWLNRDPLDEAGGVNLYGFIGNNPSNEIDLLGMISSEDVHKDISALSLEIFAARSAMERFDEYRREFLAYRRSFDRDTMVKALCEYAASSAKVAGLRDQAQASLKSFLDEQNARSSISLFLSGVPNAGGRLHERLTGVLQELAEAQERGVFAEDMLTAALVGDAALQVGLGNLANRYTDLNANIDAAMALGEAIDTGLTLATVAKSAISLAGSALYTESKVAVNAAKGGFGAIGFDQLPTGAASSALRDVYLGEAGSRMFRAKLGIQNFFTGGKVTPGQIAEQLATNTEFRLVSNIARSNINLVGGRYVVGGVEGSGYVARTVSHHEMMHMAQFIRNPNITTTGFGAMRHEILPSFVGTPEIYGGASFLLGGGVYLGTRQ